MPKVSTDSKIPILGKSPLAPPTKTFSRLASNFSSKVRAHLSQDSQKLRPSSGMILSFLTPGSRSKTTKRAVQRPSGFYQPLVCEWSTSTPTTKSEDCSPLKEPINNDQLGRRVAFGSKTGILRFYGRIELGEGNWCGIELDAPDGQCDGSINNRQYFTCQPQHGIFIPESKVYLIPNVDSGPHSLLLCREDVGASSDLDAISPINTHANSRPSSEISTPGSSSLPLFELTVSSLNSSACSLVPRSQNPIQDSSLHSKHSSFELDESLGILTPDQMSDFTLNCALELQRTPSVEELSSFMLQDVSIDMNDTIANSTPNESLNFDTDDLKLSSLTIKENNESTLIVHDSFPKDISEEGELSESAASKKTSDISSSLQTSKKGHEICRADRTPSLEDLPLDIGSEEAKAELNKIRSGPPPNSFITSITSITSLDNGYQGDGEWSRPASRGPEHSPSAQPKGPKAKLDPMTDSDFFTESDADMHEECAGHRRAQVIDGTLYGGLPPQAGIANLAGNQVQRFSPTNEEMDSSGIFSDFDKKCEEPMWEKSNVVEDERIASPEGSIMTVSSKSDQSLKKISPTTFTTLISEKLDTIKNLINSEECDVLGDLDSGESDAKKARCSPPLPKKSSESAGNKMFKTPKRNVVSKIKTMITTGPTPLKKEGDTENQENRVPRSAKKGKWDAVMNKIAQGQAQDRTTPKIKEVKSKVFSGITPTNGTTTRPTTAGGCRKAASTRCLSTAQSISTRSLRDITTIKTKRYESRRSRIRSSESSLQGPTPGSQASSRNSSISDLSQAKPSPSQRSSKKREARCSSPQSDGSTNSTASQAPKKSQTNSQSQKNQNTGKNVGTAEKQMLVRKTTPRRSTLASSKPQPLRDHNRVSNGGGNGGKSENGYGLKGSPVVRGQTLPTINATLPKAPPAPDPKAIAALNHAAKGSEALAILVNYLVYHLEAFSTPKLKKDLQNLNTEWIKSKLELEEMQVSYNQLKTDFNFEKKSHEEAFEEAHRCYEEEKNELSEKFKQEYNKLSSYHKEKLDEVKHDFEMKEKLLRERYEKEVEELKTLHSFQIETLRKENLNETERLKKEYCKIIKEGNDREVQLKKQLDDVESDYDHLKQKSEIFLAAVGKDAKLKLSMQQTSELQKEIDSLRSVLDLKSSELLELRRQSQLWQRDAEILPQTQQKVMTLQARVEDLQARLNDKESTEQKLVQEIGSLSQKVEKESTQKKRLSMQNEELQWKLKKNCEVVNALAALSGPGVTTPPKCTSRPPYSLNKTASEADIDGSRMMFGQGNCNGIQSPPGSPMVKSLVEKSESVAWMLDMYDEPESIASKILKRAQSLRSTPLTPQTQPRSAQHKSRNRSSKSLSISSPSKSDRSKSSPCTPELRKSPDGDSWVDEEEHITEEVIVVKSIGNRNVLELFDVDNTEIHIEDLPKKELSEEDIEMLRRVEQPGFRAEVLLPKESGGEAMISGEASDDEDNGDEDELDSIQVSSSDEDFSDQEIDSSLNDQDIKIESLYANSLQKDAMIHSQD